MIHDDCPEEEKPWGCFHLSDKAGKWPPSLLERTFDGQRTASGKAARGDRNGLIIMLVLFANGRKSKNKSYEKHKTKYTKNIK